MYVSVISSPNVNFWSNLFQKTCNMNFLDYFPEKCNFQSNVNILEYFTTKNVPVNFLEKITLKNE